MILRSLLMMDLPPSEDPERSGDGLGVVGAGVANARRLAV